MNDCANGDIRDLLPDLLHDRLDSAARRTVEVHLASCADCRAELALLQDVRASLRVSPVLDLTAIGAAIPPHRARSTRAWSNWRIAASLALLAAGAASVALLNRAPAPSTAEMTAVHAAPSAPSVPAPTRADTHASAGVVAAPVSTPQPVKSVLPERTRELASTRELHVAEGALGDLSETELTSLLKEIEALDALPSTYVESHAIAPIAPTRGGA